MLRHKVAGWNVLRAAASAKLRVGADPDDQDPQRERISARVGGLKPPFSGVWENGLGHAWGCPCEHFHLFVLTRRLRKIEPPITGEVLSATSLHVYFSPGGSNGGFGPTRPSCLVEALRLLGRDTEAFEFGMAVAFSDPEIEPSTGHEVEGCGLLGEQNWVVPGQHQHGGAKAERRRARGEPSQKLQRRGDLVPAREVVLDEEGAQ